MSITELHDATLRDDADVRTAAGLAAVSWPTSSTRTYRIGPAEPRHGHRRRPPAGTPVTEAASINVSFEVTLSGDDRFADAAEVLDALQRVTDRLASARLHVHPPLRSASPSDAKRSPSDVESPAPVGPGRARLEVVPVVFPSVRHDTAIENRVLVLAKAREVRVGSQIIPFTRIEFDLLHFLARHPRQVFTREQLLQRVWGFARGGHRTVDVHIRRLRAKLTGREVATTVRGVGYRLAEDANIHVGAEGGEGLVVPASGR